MPGAPTRDEGDSARGGVPGEDDFVVGVEGERGVG